MISNIIVLISIFFANVENAIRKMSRSEIFIGKLQKYKIRPLGIPNGAFSPNIALLCEPKPEYSSLPSAETDITTKLSAMGAGLAIVNESSLLKGKGNFPTMPE